MLNDKGNQFDFQSSILVRIALTKNIYIFHKVVFMREREKGGDRERKRDRGRETKRGGERDTTWS